MNHLDDLPTHSLRAFFEQLRRDAEEFLHAKNPLDHGAYLANIAAIKAMPLPISGRPHGEVVHDIRVNIMPGAIHQHHKNYVAYPDTGMHVSAQYAAMLADVMNQNQIADTKSSPTGTYVEMLVIGWLRELVGFKTTSGIPQSAHELGGAMVTGGVLANTIGVLAARQHVCPASKTRGMMAFDKTPKIFVAGSTMNHYSHYGASWWLGFGTDNVIEVDCTDKGTMDQADLRQKLQRSYSEGELPVAIIAVMGDSRTNALEDLPALYRISQDFGVWLHVDACHGGVLAFDRDATFDDKHVLSYSDSLAMDPHKHLGVPYAGSVVLVKDPAHLTAIGSSTDITISHGSADIGQVTPFLGSRAFDALKVYAVLTALGVDGIHDDIRARRDATTRWHAVLAGSQYFVPLHEPDLFALTFSLKPGSMPASQLSEKNTQVHDQLYRDGQVVVNKFNLRDYGNALSLGRGQKITCLGSLFGRGDYRDDDLRELLAVLEHAAVAVLNT